MMVISRSQSFCVVPSDSGGDINDDDDNNELVLHINAFGFLGLILARGKRMVDEMSNLSNGPISLLQKVTKSYQ